MRRLFSFTVLFAFVLFVFGFSFAAQGWQETGQCTAWDPSSNLPLIKERFGADVARLYANVDGLPVFDPSGNKGLKIRYRREKNPCSRIFLKENPDMAEECRKVQEELTFKNQHRKKLKVQMKDGKIASIRISTSYDGKDPVKSRDVILLNDAFIVHDTVLDRYSQNHAKIYHFVGVRPCVEFDRENNVFVRFGERDFIKFYAHNFRKTECQGFRLSCKPKFYRNGTRAIPDVSYVGDIPHMMTTNWSYPPLSGYFTLYDGPKKVGKMPATFLYKRLSNDRALPLFAQEGLYNYLKRSCKDGSLKARHGNAVNRSVETLLKAQK
jgi:hypothetical protein